VIPETSVLVGSEIYTVICAYIMLTLYCIHIVIYSRMYTILYTLSYEAILYTVCTVLYTLSYVVICVYCTIIVICNYMFVHLTI